MKRILTALALGLLLTAAALAAGSTEFVVDPQSQTVEAGDAFSVDVALSTTQEIDFARVYLEWDPAYLELADVTGGGTLTETYRAVVAETADYRARAPEPVSGTFVVATFGFTATSPVTETALALHPSRTKVKLDGSLLLSDKTGGTVTVEELEPEPEPPQPPQFKALILVEPGAEVVSPGETFWATVWVLDAFEVVGWEGRLTYSGDSLRTTGAYVLGGFLPASCAIQAVDFGGGEVAGMQYDGVEHTGNGRLMAVQFEAEKPGASTLAFTQTTGAGILFHIDGSAQPLLVDPPPKQVTVGSCLGDFAPDWGFRDLADIMAMLGSWNSDEGDGVYRADMDLYPRDDPDGHIGLGDVMVVVSVWNTPCP